MARVLLRNLNKSFDGVQAVKDVNLEIRDKEFLVLVGPSGCGKSTCLRMIAGLEDVTSGEIYIGDRVVNNVDPKDRDIAMVFQNYALYPHMSVYDNMAFGLKLRHVPAQEIKKRFDTSVSAADASTPDKICALLQRSEVALCAGRAGVQILSRADLKGADNLLAAADVNAVPPAGVAGLDPQNEGDPIIDTNVLGIGALAIGNVKYQAESGLFKRMVEANEALALDFRDAFRLARELA